MTARNAVQKATAGAEAPPGKNGFSLISSEKLIELYAAMLKCRMIAERVDRLLQMGALESGGSASVGREATLAGVAIDLHQEDTLSPSGDEFVSSFIKDRALNTIFSSFAEGANGHGQLARIANGRGHTPSIAVPASPAADAHLNLACDAALAHKRAKNGRIAVAYSGDGAASLERLPDALSFAGLHDLPILFVRCQAASEEPDDLTTENRPQEIETGLNPRRVPVITVDGNDAVAIYRVASESINRARLGRGPTLIDCWAYGTGKKSANGLERADDGESRDPIRSMESYLMRKGLFSLEMKQQITHGFSRELDAATRFLNN